MVFHCWRCDKKFKTKGALQNHLNGMPCDFMCQKCGVIQVSKKAYKKHIAQGCEAVSYKSEKEYIEAKKEKLGDMCKFNNIFSGGNINIDGTIHGDVNITLIYNPTVINKTFENVQEREVKAFGICPHETERPELFARHYGEIKKLISNFIRKNGAPPYDNEELKNLVIEIVRLYYQNPQYPDAINILDDDPKSNHNKVYSGKQFVTDEMTKAIRNARILQILLDTLVRFKSIRGSPRSLINFVDNVLFPHVLKCYCNETYHTSLQEIWKGNKYIIDRHSDWMKYDSHVEPISMYSQIKDFKEQDDKYQELYDRHRRVEIESLLKDSGAKYVEEGFRKAGLNLKAFEQK